MTLKLRTAFDILFRVIDIYVVAIMDITAHDEQFVPLFIKMHCG